MEFYEELGKQINKFRKAQDLTQQELAEKAKVVPGFISKIENGKTAISFDVFVRIITALEYAVRIENGKVNFYRME